MAFFALIPAQDMISPTLSFCITCKNRFAQIAQTLGKNLDNNLVDREWIEFVLVDFASTDGLRKWVLDTFPEDLESGYLKYYHNEALEYWHASIAKNTAHWCASGDIVVNLDCDNFTGHFGGLFVLEFFRENPDIILHQYSGDWRSGSYGRIAVRREHFARIGGYDESFLPMARQDTDLMERLQRLGLTLVHQPDPRYCQAVPNSKAESIRYCRPGVDYPTMQRVNYERSTQNLAAGKIVANGGLFGIRENLFDHRGRAFRGNDPVGHSNP